MVIKGLKKIAKKIERSDINLESDSEGTAILTNLTDIPLWDHDEI